MKLPEPEYVPTTDAYGRNTYREYYTAAQMREYRNATLEEAAKVCETLDPVCYDTAGYMDCAAAIRNLKEVQS